MTQRGDVIYPQPPAPAQQQNEAVNSGVVTPQPEA